MSRRFLAKLLRTLEFLLRNTTICPLGNKLQIPFSSLLEVPLPRGSPRAAPNRLQRDPPRSLRQGQTGRPRER